MLKILHIIQTLSNGGATRSMLAAAKYLDNTQQSIVSLLPADTFGIQLAKEARMKVQEAPDKETLTRAIENADIVHIHFWNTPEMYELLQSELPAMRLLMTFHIAGDKPPQVITRELIDYADFALATGPYTYELPLIQDLPAEIKLQKTAMIYSGADFERLENLQPKPHDTFNVGYIGTIHFVKMHPNYIPMSAFIKIPNVRFIVCGGDGVQLRKQALQLGVENQFDFRGYVEDIQSVLEILDVFGYPLCEDNYSTAEQVLQEAMYAGIPSVIFSHGGAQRTVVHNYTGLIVNSELEYKEAIEYLYHYPEERARLGETAQKYAKALFGGENAAKATDGVYQRLMQQPKHKREWGITPGVSALEQTVSVFDLIRQSDEPSGAELFIQSLGDTAPQFTISLTSPHIHELFEVEQKIALSSPLLSSKYVGGILNYRNYYPNDAYLRLWAGLVLHQQGQYADAIIEFTAAINLGCEHWRVIWYLAQAAEKANQSALAEKMVREVIRVTVRDFQPAHDMLVHLLEVKQKLSKTPQQRIADEITNVCGNLEGKVILERGCDKEGQLISTLIKEYHAKEIIGIHANHDSQTICEVGRIEKTADTSSFADNYFDLVISNFYQTPPFEKFLTEMLRILKPNGFLYTTIASLWSCAWGHQFGVVHQGKTYHVQNTVLPPYCHLLITKEELLEHCLAHYEPELSEKMVACIFNVSAQNRLFFEDYAKIVNCSLFEIITIKGLTDEQLAKTYQPENIEQTLTRLRDKYSGYQDFSSNAIHLVLKKTAKTYPDKSWFWPILDKYRDADGHTLEEIKEAEQWTWQPKTEESLEQLITLLEDLFSIDEAFTYLEFGTCFGTTLTRLLTHFKKARAIGIETDEAKFKITHWLIEQMDRQRQLSNRVKLYNIHFNDVSLKAHSIDLIFMDGSHKYPDDFDLIMQLLTSDVLREVFLLVGELTVQNQETQNKLIKEVGEHYNVIIKPDENLWLLFKA